jgi:hypothetical protein
LVKDIGAAGVVGVLLEKVFVGNGCFHIPFGLEVSIGNFDFCKNVEFR